MNKVLIYLVILVCIGCSGGQSDYDWEYITTITFINETMVSDISCEVPDIPAKSTLEYIHTQYYSANGKHDKPSLENIETFVPCNFYYGNTTKCEPGVNDVFERENRKQIGEFNFEFTFRFTDERFQNAEDCR